MSGSEALNWATLIAMGLLLAALALTLLRLVRGPALPDRILALDVMTTLALCFIAVFTIKTGFALYLDIAISLGLVGFLATVAFARYVLARGQAERSATEAPPVAPIVAPVVAEPEKNRASRGRNAHDR